MTDERSSRPDSDAEDSLVDAAAGSDGPHPKPRGQTDEASQVADREGNSPSQAPVPTTPAASSSGKMLSASAVMASGTLISRVLGFVRVMLVAFVLGNGTRQADILSLALLIPNTLYMLFAGGTLNTVLVPQVVRRVMNDADGGKGYVDRIMTAFLVALAAITAVMTLITPLLLMLWVNQSWRSVSMADHYAALTFMTYLTMPQLFFYGAFFLVGQVLNAKEKFAPLMWAPILNNVISIAILGAYVWIWGLRGDANAVFTSPQIWLLGLGSTVGIIGQTLLLIPYLRRAGFNYRPRWDLKGTGLGATFHLAKWMIGYVALTVVAQTVVSNLATSATAGGAGAGYNVYSNAYLLWILPHSLITVSLATAMMPNASRRAATGDLEGVERATTEAVRLASTFLLPFAVGFAVLAHPLAALGFGHGRGAADAALVGTTLIAFALGLVPFTIQYLYQRAYYALEDTRSTFLLQIVISGSNALLALAFVLPFHHPDTVAARLAMSYSVAYVLGVGVTHVFLKRKLPTLDGRATLTHLWRLTLAILPGAIVAWLITWQFGRFPELPLQVLGLVLAAVTAVLSFFFVAKRMQITEAAQVLDVLRRRGGTAPEPPGEEEVPGKAAAGEPAVHEENEDDASPDGRGVFIPMGPPQTSALRFYPDPGLSGNAAPGDSLDPSHPGLDQRYRLDELLARRLGTVTWRGFDLRLSRAVLIHVLATSDPNAPHLLKLARQAAVATDSRFLRVLDVAEATEEHGSYIVYEYVAGTSLEQVLDVGSLTSFEAAWVVRELADALIGLHAQGLCHQRLNPDTVIITATGNVKIVGFLVEAALTTDPMPELDPEAADVQALGQLLYACLVNRWPGKDAYGLRAAPQEGSRVLTPSQVKAGVSRAVDQVCDRILSTAPRGKLPRITTAHDVMMQLTLVLGSINAAHDLERRLRMPVPQFAPTSGPARRVIEAPLLQSHGASGIEQGGSTTAPPFDADDHPEIATGQLTGDELAAADEPFTPIPPPPSKAGADVGLNPTREPSRRFMGLLIGAFGVILALSLIWVAVGQLSDRAAPSPTSTVPIVLTVSTAKDFDPVVDGGSSHENARLIGRILDGSARSAWTTERYRGDPRLGGLKPGVGVVLDLGKPMTVSGVTVVLGGEGTSLELRVPAEEATEAPMRSHTQWRTVVGAEKASGSTNLTPLEPVTTRFLLLYLTSLPPVDGGYFQGSISALEVRG